MQIESAIRPIININNKFEISGISILSKNKKIINGGNYYVAKSSMLQNMKFEKIQELHVGILDDTDKIYFLHNIKINRNKNKEYINVDFGQTAKISGLKNINIFFNKQNEETKIKNKYISLYYSPIKKDRMDEIKDIAEFYLSKEKKQNIYYKDINLNTNLLKTNSNKTWLKTNLKLKKEKINENENYEYIGNICINENTYYDYEKEKTLKGYEQNSKIGEFIPYSFKWTYKRFQEYNPFYFLKNFIFKTKKYYSNSILNYLDGEILLQIKENKKDLQNYLSINSTNIKEIKDSKKISLKAIKRMSYYDS